VANADRDNLDQHLACLRIVHLHRLNLKRRASLAHNGNFNV
jgi:hypothetical protein